MTTKIVLATRNRGKLAEFRQLFAGIPDLELVSVEDVPTAPANVVEDGFTFRENAQKKAFEVGKATGLLSLADDSGLEVDALGGAPGVLSARFAGARATDGENNRHLLSLLAEIPTPDRTARFRCVLCFYDPRKGGADVAGALHFEEGLCEGRIVQGARGTSGFGYDPLFVPDSEERTLAELGAEKKNALSHRAEAARKMAVYLAKMRESR